MKETQKNGKEAHVSHVRSGSGLMVDKVEETLLKAQELMMRSRYCCNFSM